MKLKEYLIRNKLKARWVAERTGVTISAARKWRQGIRMPRLSAIKTIHKITKGEVSFDDWG